MARYEALLPSSPLPYYDIGSMINPVTQTNSMLDYSAMFIMKIKEYLMLKPVKNKYLNILKIVALVGWDKFFAWISQLFNSYYNLRIKHKMPSIMDYKYYITIEYDRTPSIDKKLIHIICNIFKATHKQKQEIIIFDNGQREKLNINEYGINFFHNNICYHIMAQQKKYVIKCSSNIIQCGEIAIRAHTLYEVEGKMTIVTHIKTISDRGNYSIVRPIKRSLKNIYLQSDILAVINIFLEKYNTIKEKYYSMNMIHKTVFMVYGPPGTGKTSLAEVIASELKRELALINLREISNINSLQNIIQNCSNDVIVFEEIDWVLQGMEKNNQLQMNQLQMNQLQMNQLQMNPSLKGLSDSKDLDFMYQSPSSQNININDLLETLDGLRSVNDTIFFLTTNNINKIDFALKRHGRIDYLLEIKLCNTEQFGKIYYDLLNKNVTEEQLKLFPEYKYSTALIISSLIQNITEIDKMNFSYILKLFEAQHEKYQKILEDKNEK